MSTSSCARPRASRASRRAGRRRSRSSCRSGCGLGSRDRPPVPRRAGRRRPARCRATARRRAPVATRSVSARWTRWVTSRQKSYAEPVTVCAASSGPQVQVSPDGRGQLDPELLGRRLEPVHREGEVAGADAEVGDVPDPVGRLGRRRRAPRSTSSACAQVSMNRAVAIEAGRHRRAEPRHLLPVGQAAQRRGERRRGRAASGRAAPAGGSRGDLERGGVDVARRVVDRRQHQRRPRPALSVARGERRLVGPEQVGDLGGDVPAGGRGRACASPSSSRPATALQSRSPSAVEVGEQVRASEVGHAARSEGVVEGGGPLVEDPVAAAGVVGDRVGQAEAADQVEGGLHELAHARPRLVGAEQLDGQPVGLAADPLLQRRDGGQQRRRRCAPRPTARGRR